MRSFCHGKSAVFADPMCLQHPMLSIFSQVIVFAVSLKHEELYNLWETSVYVSSLKQKN